MPAARAPSGRRAAAVAAPAPPGAVGVPTLPETRPVDPAEEPPEHADLTPREREVVRLVAQGMTSREVAAALYVTPKAISYHLGNVFAKLGVTSRRQLWGRQLIGHTWPPFGGTENLVEQRRAGRRRWLWIVGAGVGVIAVALAVVGVLGVREATADPGTGMLRLAHLSPSTRPSTCTRRGRTCR